MPAASSTGVGPSSEPLSASPANGVSESNTSIEANVVVLGLRRAGKSSILSVVYKSMPPDDTFFLVESSSSKGKPAPIDVDAFLKMRFWDGIDAPTTAANLIAQNSHESGDQRGRIAYGTAGQLYWTQCSAIVFVIDAQAEFFEAVSRLNDVILEAYASNPLIHFHIFVHKVDGLSSDYRYETLRDIEQRVLDNLSDASASFIFAPAAHHVVQAAKSSRQSSGTSTDRPSPFDQSEGGGTAYKGVGGFYIPSLEESPNLEADVRLSFHATSIFDSSVHVAFSRIQIAMMNADLANTLEVLCNSLCNSSKLEKVYVFDVPSLTYICADSSPFDENSFEAVSEYLRFLVQFSGLYSPLTVPSQASTGGQRAMADQEAVRNERYATSNTRLNPDLTLAFYQINTHLAIVAVTRTETFAKQSSMVNYNVSIARKAFLDLYNSAN
ncbi:hypothetical protein FA10DRAFT_298969 [Acaromyces ingoldii]|uniref:GTP-binding protein n=1 Tax=Acaromyces ingoldii TaxID=215250 RepID=A0A316YVX4_9BASI|nr:hypothetical protein FA10DRAFT_298969 [Acaromyces ingoldii]PWN93597.1 hypothetical protein FA10DRAFT_298969 [Acaromyces ingoldii]